MLRRVLWISYLVGTSLVALNILYAPHAARLPALKTARAVQWVLNAQWLETRFHEKHGEYVACDDRGAWCGERLSWVAYTRRMDDWRFEVVSDGQHFTAIARGPTELWQVKEGGEPVRMPVQP